jgi:hypothetical protein
MFIRKSPLENLLKRCESQQQEIDNLDEKLGILAQAVGHQFEFNVGKGRSLTAIKPEHNQFIDARREKARASDVSITRDSQ